jgi:hypothetical protein
MGHLCFDQPGNLMPLCRRFVVDLRCFLYLPARRRRRSSSCKQRASESELVGRTQRMPKAIWAISVWSDAESVRCHIASTIYKRRKNTAT